LILLLILSLFVPVLFLGCSGDDGSTGAAGSSTLAAVTIEPAGANCANGGQKLTSGVDDNGNGILDPAEVDSTQYVCNGTSAAAGSAAETCTVCHAAGSEFSASQAHAITGQYSVDTVVVTPIVGGVTVAFNVKLDGVPYNDFPFLFRAYEYAASATPHATYTGTDNVIYPVVNDFTRTTVTDNSTISSRVGGRYTVTINDPPPADNVVTYLVTVGIDNTETQPAATAVGNLTTAVRSIASSQACINCHGDNPLFREPNEDLEEFGHHGANPFPVEACTVCHTRYNSTARRVAGSRLTAYVHGIHNAHSMPSKVLSATVTKPEFVYARNDSTNEASWYHTTYPSYMENCSVCHDTPARLAIVNAAPVEGWFCLSCHDSMASPAWAAGFSTLTFHNAYNETTNCQQCHGGPTPIARTQHSEFHNGLRTERAGLIWNGEDLSVTEGAKVDMQITGVSINTDNTVVAWTATYNGTAVNPCNTTVAANAPIFHAGGAADNTTGKAASNFSILRAYGQGDDWTNAGIGSTSPGQPLSTNLSTTNTACSGNVATTTIARTAGEKATTLQRGIVALQGKAQVKLGFDYNSALAGTQDVIQVRSKTPSRAFAVSTGAAVTARRAIVDSTKCLKCHVGSLYQHGGNRIDDAAMCVMCHNEASNEQNVRINDGVTASEAYDGKAGQTYGFKTMLHAIHSAGETGAPIVIYRSFGIFAWAKDNSVLNNWPGTGSRKIFGSNDNVANRTHNFHSPTYPKALNDCSACHVPGFAVLPDQTKAVATTLEASTAPYDNLLNDVLEGPAAAACMSCHQSSNSGEQAALKGHAYQFGFVPAVFPNGLVDVLNP
jgi:OmcA/MtrC family decaheme c-type cytochrome